MAINNHHHLIGDIRAMLKLSMEIGIPLEAVRALFRAYEENTRDIQRLHDLMDNKIPGIPAWETRSEDNRYFIITSTMKSVLLRWEALGGDAN